VTTGILASPPTIDIVASSGAKESLIATLVDGTSMATSAPETAIIKALVTTLEIGQLVLKLTPVLTEEASASIAAARTMSLSPTLAASTPTTVVSSSLPSTPARSSPIVNILEGLITWVIDQYLFMMEFCIDLVLIGQSFFDLVRSLLDYHVENIKKVGGTERAAEYQARVKQLEQCLADLHDFENASVADAARY